MGISLTTLYEEYDTRTFINHLNGYWDHIKTRHQNEWEVGRAFTFHLLNIQIEPKNRYRKMTDFMQFPWEMNGQQPKQRLPLSAADKEYIRKQFEP